MVVFEEATFLDLRFFLHVSIFQFFDLHPKSISPKKQLSKDLQTILSGHKSCSFFGKQSRWPGKSTSLEENDRFRSEADFWRFGLRDLHGLMLEGWYWMGFLLSKMSVGADFRCLFFVFFQIFPSILSILFLGRSFFFEDQLVKRWPRRNAWYLRTCAGSM